jgi:hypothetical protein
MYRILELPENLEAPIRYFEVEKPIVCSFWRESPYLSTRLLRANDLKGGTFPPEK